MGRICETSSAGVTFGFEATPIESSFPTLLNRRCAVGRSKMRASLTPSELRPPNFTRPTIRKVFTGPRSTTPIVSPTA